MYFTKTKYHSRFFTNDSIILNGLIVLLASIVLALVSQIALPWQPVPLTFQSAMVILLGLTLGSKRASAAVVLYLLEGTSGLPVFAGGYSGISVFLTPSAGYLIGFLPAAYIAGFLMEKGMVKDVLRIFITALLSAMIIFAFGVLHLQFLMGWKKAFMFGVQPFLITEPVKLLIASFLAKLSWKKV
ncbi:MAG: hypothetical protein A3F13_08305 [Gammaproteobacteria bacterium RIFCSPHIGHO2_12_FULL_40_19]|nr:MAG: hypothetical protein A3F13_08305 [Gammaproteobacteria bacterium RIFCSPHIGHO2_12_FULL_40_19]